MCVCVCLCLVGGVLIQEEGVKITLLPTCPESRSYPGWLRSHQKSGCVQEDAWEVGCCAMDRTVSIHLFVCLT